MPPQIPSYVFDIFTAATAIAVIMQACILLGMFLGLRKFQAKIEKILDPLAEQALPLIASSRATLEELSPKLKIIASNLAEVSEALKHETQNLKVSVDDVLEKTRAQTARVDEMVSGTLDGLSQAASAIQQGIEPPLRKIHGVFNGLKAGIAEFRRKTPKVPVEPVPVYAHSPDPEVFEVAAEDVVVVAVDEVVDPRPVL